jgi:hypothetical protein
MKCVFFINPMGFTRKVKPTNAHSQVLHKAALAVGGSIMVGKGPSAPDLLKMKSPHAQAFHFLKFPEGSSTL